MIKTGACSIILSADYYKKHLEVKKDKLLKITKKIKGHDEFKYLDEIRKINNYEKYYSIPDKEGYIIQKEHPFYGNIQELVKDEGMNIFQGNLECYYVSYAGDIDLLDSIISVRDRCDYTFWKSYKKINNFIKFLLEGLSFLHSRKIAHLDIKPENVVINTRKNTYKIIDFGFASVEPFDDFVYNTKGTPGYFPKNFPTPVYEPWLPEIKANDLKGGVHMIKNRKLVYQIDSYCLGRTLYYLKYVYDDNVFYECFNYERTMGKRIDKIISDLLESDVHKRINISECLNKYFT